MTNGAKIALIIAVVLIVLGAVIALGSLSTGSFKWSDLEEHYTSRTVTPGGSFDNISVHTAEHDIALLPSDDGVCRVIFDESERVKISVEVAGGTLTVRTEQNSKLFSFGVHSATPRITLYLPQNEYRAVDLLTSSGDVNIASGFVFDSLDIRTTSGDITAESNVADTLKLSSSSGEIYFSGSANSANASSTSGDVAFYGSVAGALEVGCTSGDVAIRGSADSLDAHTVSGELELEDFTAVGKAKLHSTSGEIRLDRCDAGEFDVSCTSGGISGSLLSGKVFKCSSTSGDIRIPHDYPGGDIFKAHTTSGDIRITVE